MDRSEWVLVPRNPVEALPILHALADAAGLERLPDPNDDGSYPITGQQSTVRQWYTAMIAAAPPPPAEQASGGHVASDETVDSLYSELFCTGKYLRASVPIDPKEVIRRHLIAVLSQRPVVSLSGSVNGYLPRQQAIEIKADAPLPEWLTSEPNLRVTVTLAPQQPEKGEG